MKLLKLVVGGFGVLSGRTIELGGRSSVLYGKNEAGKTSFIDALLDALYGERPKGPRAAPERTWVARYGEAPAASSVEMITSQGAPAVSSSGRPTGSAIAESSLARAVLILRAGETAVAGSLDFLPAFIAKVSGGSAVSIDEAVDTLATFIGKSKASRLPKLENSLSQKIKTLEERLRSAADLESISKQEAEVQAREGALREDLAREAAVEESISKARDRRKVGLFEGRLASLEQDEGTIGGLGAFDKALHQEALGHEEKRGGCAQRVAVARALAAQAVGRVSETERRLAAVRDEQSRQPNGEKRALLKLKLDERKIAEQAASGGESDQTGILRAAFSALGALLGGGVLWLIFGKIGLALAGAAVGAAAGYFLAGQFPGRKSAAATDPRESAARLRGVIDDMGERWRGLTPEEAEKRLDEIENRYRALSLESDQCVRGLEEARAAHRKHEDEIRAAEADELAHTVQIKDLLRRLGAASFDDCAQRLAQLDQARAALASGIQETERLLGQKAGSVDAAKKLLRVRLEQLRQSAEGADPELVALGDGELDQRWRDSQRKKGTLEATRQSLGPQLRQLNQNKVVLQERIGGSLVDVYREKLRSESSLAELQAWRRAGGLAKEALELFSTGIEEQVRDCVGKAGPLFSAMSGGAYQGLRLKDGAALDGDGIEVEHAVHGWKPFPWMSTGACDLLWLALRISFARQAFPAPAFLVLDEPFHTLDSERAANALRSLAQVPESQGWQIIILTKDPLIAACSGAAGLSRIDLTA